MPYFLASRVKMNTQISAFRLGDFEGDYCGNVVSIREGRDSNTREIERMSWREYESQGFEQIFLRHWRDISGFTPFTILKRRNGRYFPDVLSFVPTGKTVTRIKGRNGRYTVSYA